MPEMEGQGDIFQLPQENVLPETVRTHMLVAAFRENGKPVHQAVCGEEMLGHGSWTGFTQRVTCGRCIDAMAARSASYAKWFQHVVSAATVVPA